MLAEIGIVTETLALLAAVYAVVAALWSVQKRERRWLHSARNAVAVSWLMITAALLALLIELINADFSLLYVYNTTDRASDLALRITALWGGQAGSLLFWSWIMGAFALAAVLSNWDTDRRFMPYVIAVTIGTLAFFLSLTVFFENPFDRFWQDPSGNVIVSALQPPNTWPLAQRDGLGMNPLLRHPGMLIHPPTLYLGYVGLVIPFAFAVAALATGDLSPRWIRATKTWALIAWLFLSLGLLLGMRWAYDVLGWGGYWGWDPVENSALLPWLTGTAFLHSVLIQEKRGMLKKWNMVLIIITYLLVVLGTFSTRSGIVSSVHSFAESPIGGPMLVFLAVSVGIALWLLFRRWDSLRSEAELDSVFSREAFFIINNMLFAGLTIATFWGTYAPIFSELLTGEKITMGPPYFESVNGPLFGVLFLLMGLAPLLAWRRTSTRHLIRALAIPTVLALALVVVIFISGTRHPVALLGFGVVGFAGFSTLAEYWKGAVARHRSRGEPYLLGLLNLFKRNRHRYGGYLIHLGIVIIAFGIIGSSIFQEETQQRLAAGESLVIDGYEMVFEGLDQGMAPDGSKYVVQARVSVYQNGQLVARLNPRRDIFINPHGAQDLTSPSVYSTVGGDFYVILVSWEEIGDEGTTFKVYLNPLVGWIWWGGVILVIGTLIAVWPDRRESRIRSRALATGLAGSSEVA